MAQRGENKKFTVLSRRAALQNEQTPISVHARWKSRRSNNHVLLYYLLTETQKPSRVKRRNFLHENFWLY